MDVVNLVGMFQQSTLFLMCYSNGYVEYVDVLTGEKL